MRFLSHPKRTIVLIGVFLFFFFYSLILLISFTQRKATEATDRLAQEPQYVTDIPVSKQVTVEKKVLAKKLDLDRKMISPKSPQDVARITSIIEKEGGKVIDAKGSVLVADIPQTAEQSVTQSLQQSNAIKSLEVDYPTFVTSDTPDWGVTHIKAPDVWKTTTGSGVRVAIIDTGIDYTHPELRGSYAGGFDAVNEDTDPFDDNGHGTHVAGIIAAALNGSGTEGVAPGVQILSGKALGSDGSGYISDLVEAINWAEQNGAQVINYSLGSTYNSKILEDTINQAASKGIIQVAAAGNNSGGSLEYPAAYGAVISVAATDSSDHLAGFSAFGAEVAAPGVGITSSVPGGGYATWSGTSMAAPHVTATVALMLANKQTNIRQELHDTAVDLGPSGRDNYFGYGLIDAKPAALGEDTLAPVVTFLSPTDNAYVNGDVTISASIQDEYNVSDAKLFVNNEQVASWTQAPYTYTWHTSGLAYGSYTFLIQATDENKNVGQAQIALNLSDVTPTPVQPTKVEGQSGAVRQDTSNVNAEEHRQNNDTPASEHQSNSQSSTQSQAPETSNADQRNQKPDTQSTHGQSGEEHGKDVKGAATVSLWQMIRATFFQLFYR